MLMEIRQTHSITINQNKQDRLMIILIKNKLANQTININRLNLMARKNTN
jgi:hypothetical protein